MIRLLALALAALLVPGAARAGDLPANELGQVMILEYHRIDIPEARWTRTPENFRRDLERLYAAGYRLVALNDVLAGRIRTPAGTTPVVLTFDDSSPGQFRYLGDNGTLRIDPRSAVGILEAFAAEQPDFGLAATFFVLPGADRPHRLFDQPEHEGRKLRYLVSRGFEIGNHTLWHAHLGRYPAGVVRAQLADAQRWVERHVPGYRLRTLALPFGAYPREVGWAVEGTAGGTSYRHEAILMVAGGAAPSPFTRGFDPLRLPRIQAVERDLDHWLTYFERNPAQRFVSDGDPEAITIPVGQRERLRSRLPDGVRIVERADSPGGPPASRGRLAVVESAAVRPAVPDGRRDRERDNSVSAPAAQAGAEARATGR